LEDYSCVLLILSRLHFHEKTSFFKAKMLSLIKRLVGGYSKQNCQTDSEHVEREDKVEVLINFSNQFSHDDIYSNLKEAISKKPSVLEIDLIGHAALPQDLCLSLWYLLTEDKDPKTHLLVRCSANLIDGELLLVLAADEKKIRPHTWLEISSVESYDPSLLTDFQSVLKNINRYLPCGQLSQEGRVDVQSTFREYGLLNSEQEEESFRNLFRSPAEV